MTAKETTPKAECIRLIHEAVPGMASYNHQFEGNNLRCSRCAVAVFEDVDCMPEFRKANLQDVLIALDGHQRVLIISVIENYNLHKDAESQSDEFYEFLLPLLND